MDTKELIERFLEETNYEQEAVLIIAYGSRITYEDKEYSDLDLLVITAKEGYYKEALIIDGIPIDITIMSIEEASDDILYSKASGSTYFDSVLINGRVIIDKIGLYEELKSLLRKKIPKKRFIDGNLFHRVEYHIFEFLNNSENGNIHYFSALDLMRRLFHAIHNLSNIQSIKVFDLYTNKKKAREEYILKLPDDEFTNDYLRALQETDRDKQISFLKRFYSKIEPFQITASGSNYVDSTQRDIMLISINNAIWKCEDMILSDHPSAKALYYMLIGEIYHLFEGIFSTKLKANVSLETCDKQTMIQNLEYLFSLVDINHDIDYNDYKIRIR